MPKFTEIPYHILKDFFLDTYVVVPEVIEYFTITTLPTSNGTISPSGSFSIREGDSVTFTFTPDDDYYISDVAIDGVTVETLDTYTFSNITDNHTISVEFDYLD